MDSPIMATQSPLFAEVLRMRRILVLLPCSCLLLGCAADVLRTDHDKIRCALLDLYTAQIMENLVRTSRGLPIVQLDYPKVNATVTVEDIAGVSDTLATTHMKTVTKAAARAVETTRTVMNTVSGNATDRHTNEVSIEADPVMTEPEAYHAYQEFLSIPGSLRVGTCLPPPGAAHLWTQCDGRYYWVPVELRKEFLLLALRAVAFRPKAGPPPDPFFSVSVLAVLETEEKSEVPASKKEKKVEVWNAILQIDQKVPNAYGEIEIPVGTGGSATAARFSIVPYWPSGGVRVRETDRLSVECKGTDAIPTADALVKLVRQGPLPVKLFLEGHRPPPPVLNRDLNRIEFQLKQIEFNQLRGAPL
jgi:hypothetical protein